MTGACRAVTACEEADAAVLVIKITGCSLVPDEQAWRGVGHLETVDLNGRCQYGPSDVGDGQVTYLDGLGIKLQTLLLVGQEFLDILTLISLELNHLAHLGVVDDGAIAGELLLDNLEDLLLVKLLGQSLDCGQGLASIALCWWGKCQQC